MRAVLSLLALAATTLAANIPRGYNHGGNSGDYGGGNKWKTVTTEVVVTYTTLCPVTETITKPGHTYTTTYTTTSTVKTVKPTTYTVTQTGPAVTKTAGEVVYTTLTSLCPVTETTVVDGSTVEVTWTSTSTIVKVAPTEVVVTQTAPPVTKTKGAIDLTTITSLCPVTETTVVDGSTVEVTWTSTSTIVKKVPQTETIRISSIVTEYERTDVYETVTCPVTTYTTVVEGKTVKVTKTNTITKAITDVHYVTEIIPVTITEHIDYTVGIPVTDRKTITGYSTVIISASKVIYTSTSLPPVTVIIPTSVTALPSNGTNVTPIPTAAANAHGPPIALVAGMLGALALF